MLHKVTIAGMTMDPSSNTPIIILKSEEDEQAIPIWIGLLEATSIASALQNIQFDRPMTHDLLLGVIDQMGGTLARVMVSDLSSNTFYARLLIERDGESIEVDSRPSDAIALAVHVGCPIFVAEKVLDEVAIQPQ